MIPKRLAHIWIGPQPAPLDWMQTWQEAHPDWAYSVLDNTYLLSRRFRCQDLIVAYAERGMWAGVADLMRYQWLFENGGFIPPADSVCLHPVDDLFVENKAYACYEFPEGQTGMITPFLASPAGNPLVGEVLDRLSTRGTANLGRPWHAVGNGFLRRLLKGRDTSADLVILDSHLFIPEHYKGWKYEGNDIVYARQFWGTTTRSYPHSRGRSPLSPEEAEARTGEIVTALKARL